MLVLGLAREGHARADGCGDKLCCAFMESVNAVASEFDF